MRNLLRSSTAGYIAGVVAVGAGDMPGETVQLHNAEAWLPNTSKHGFMGSGNGYLTKKLVEMGALTEKEADKIYQEALEEIDKAVKFAEESPFPNPAEVLMDVYA